MIRITGGTFRGRRLVVPAGARPTTDMARKAVFDLLGPGAFAAAGRVLDAAAGSGAYGFEALSRGAAEAREVTFVDSDAGAIRAIRENGARLGVTDRCVFRQMGVGTFGRAAAAGGLRFGLVFHDPPYAADSSDDLRTLLALLLPGGKLIHERGDARDPLPGGPGYADRRRYGTTWIVIYEPAEPARAD